MFGLFKKKKKKIVFAGEHVKVDMHSHLLPAIDDGSQSLEESIEMIKGFRDMGYEKLITTPHIMNDFYKNTPEIIREKLALVRAELEKQSIDIELEAAAEYYLDEGFTRKIEDGVELLTFGDNYILFETSYMNEPPQLDTVIFSLQAKGYKVVMAHPERYIYFFDQYERFKELHAQGVFLQLNLNSLTGYYSSKSKEVAEKLIDDGLISFIASDCHKDKHLDVLARARGTSYYSKLYDYSLLNNSLL